MVTEGDKLVVHERERLTVRVNTPELFETEAELRPVDKPAPLHLHPHQEERFEVLSGVLTVRFQDGERTVAAGESIDVPRGTPHTMFAAEPVRMIWQTAPALNTPRFFASLDALQRAGRVDDEGMPTLVGYGHVLHRHATEMRLSGVPGFVERPFMAVLAGLARLKGYPAAA